MVDAPHEHTIVRVKYYLFLTARDKMLNNKNKKSKTKSQAIINNFLIKNKSAL